MKLLMTILIISLLLCSEFSFAADNQSAKEHYTKATKLFKNSEYKIAEEEFKQAYNLSQKPNILYNLAICNEKIQNRDKAIAYYQLYLEEMPDASDKQSVQKKIQDLRLYQTSY